MRSGFLGAGIGPRAIARRAAAADWWTVAGQICVAAYKAIGAPSLAASYVNLANPGTNDAFPGTAPTFAAATGWTFVIANAQYLLTNYDPGDGVFNPQTLTAMIRVSAVVGNAACGALNGPQKGLRIWPSLGADMQIRNGETATIAGGAVTAGVIAVAGGNIYTNGVLVGTVAAVTATGVPALTIGAQNFNGTISQHFGGNILAFALWESVLTAPQVAAVSAAMAAL